LLQRLYERRFAGLSFRIVRGRVHEHADAPHALSLLRPRRERPGDRRATEKRNELTSPHILSHSGDSIVWAQTGTLIGAQTGIKTIAAVHSQCR
jgi:hypothetical protein